MNDKNELTDRNDLKAQLKKQKEESGERSPERTPLTTERSVASKESREIGINPEGVDNQRTLELATDQSIAARNLLYNPNESSLDVIKNCANGITSVMERLKPTDNEETDLKNDSILISMCTRLHNPLHPDHRFRTMSITNSDGCRSPIPIDADQN